MSEPTAPAPISHKWYARPAFYVSREITERSVPSAKSWWGYDVILIADPDGNELLFPYE